MTQNILKEALGGLAADYSDIRFEETTHTDLAFMGADLEDIGTTLVRGGSVRVCVRGGWGFSAFNRIEDIESSARTAAKMAELAAGDETLMAPVEPVVADIAWDGGSDPSDVPLADKHDLLKSYNDKLLEAEDIVTTTSRYRDVLTTSWLVTSEGTSIKKEEVFAGVSLMAVARDGSNVQRGVRSYGDQRGYETVLGHDGDIEDIIKITRDLMKAPKVDGGTYSVVINPLLAGVFAHEAFGHLSEADFVYENPQAREMMKLGRRFGPDFLNILDDGNIPGEAGDVPYDDEGVKGQRTHLIRDGILVGRLHSRETAGKMGEDATGNGRALNTSYRPIVRMTSTYIDEGDYSFDEMIADIDDGIYALDFLGGMTDLERFTFSSAYAFKIEKGKITTPLRDVILSGNVFETLKNVSMIGNDLSHYGGLGGCGKGGQSPLPTSVGAPHIRIENVLVG